MRRTTAVKHSLRSILGSDGDIDRGQLSWNGCPRQNVSQQDDPQIRNASVNTWSIRIIVITM